MMNKQDSKYASKMIAHHDSALVMSAEQILNGEDKEMKDFAKQVYIKQKDEIAWLKAWLKKRGINENHLSGMKNM